MWLYLTALLEYFNANFCKFMCKLHFKIFNFKLLKEINKMYQILMLEGLLVGYAKFHDKQGVGFFGMKWLIL